MNQVEIETAMQAAASVAKVRLAQIAAGSATEADPWEFKRAILLTYLKARPTTKRRSLDSTTPEQCRPQGQ